MIFAKKIEEDDEKSAIAVGFRGSKFEMMMELTQIIRGGLEKGVFTLKDIDFCMHQGKKDAIMSPSNDIVSFTGDTTEDVHNTVEDFIKGIIEEESDDE